MYIVEFRDVNNKWTKTRYESKVDMMNQLRRLIDISEEVRITNLEQERMGLR